MKKIIRKLRLIEIDVFIYQMEHYVQLDIPNFRYNINKTRQKKKWKYSIHENAEIVHQSYLFDNIFLLKSLKKKGPVIGDCLTMSKYRGQSIYPYVINKIAKEIVYKKDGVVFIIVDKDNLSSIKGIKKAGFSKLASIKAKRWLWFYLKRKITFFN